MPRQTCANALEVRAERQNRRILSKAELEPLDTLDDVLERLFSLWLIGKTCKGASWD